jgi:hypothetical protein
LRRYFWRWRWRAGDSPRRRDRPGLDREAATHGTFEGIIVDEQALDRQPAGALDLVDGVVVGGVAHAKAEHLTTTPHGQHAQAHAQRAGQRRWIDGDQRRVVELDNAHLEGCCKRGTQRSGGDQAPTAQRVNDGDVGFGRDAGGHPKGGHVGETGVDQQAG